MPDIDKELNETFQSDESPRFELNNYVESSRPSMDSKRGIRNHLAESCDVIKDATEVDESDFLKRLTIDEN